MIFLWKLTRINLFLVQDKDHRREEGARESAYHNDRVDMGHFHGSFVQSEISGNSYPAPASIEITKNSFFGHALLCGATTIEAHLIIV